MAIVMLGVLGAGTGDEIVKSSHFGFDIFHLGINNSDCLIVDGFGGELEGGVVLVCSLQHC
jgi:hypothetical protein